jgi:hypothetical protein
VLINSKKLIYLMIMVVMLSGCSTKVTIDNTNKQMGPAEKSIHIFSKEPSDKELFEDALSFLILLRHIILQSCEGYAMRSPWKPRRYFSG